MAKTVKSFPLQEQIHIFQIEMRLATTPTNPVSNPTTSGSKVKIVSNIMLSQHPLVRIQSFLNRLVQIVRVEETGHYEKN